MKSIKILNIIGSGRKKGHTAKICSLINQNLREMAKLENKSIEIEDLFLSDYTLKPCIGCRICMDRDENKCPLNDDLPQIKEKMHGVDGIIFASPVYVGDVSSLMKILIDRMAYMCHRQEFYKKCGFIIATTNATSLKRTIHTMGAALYSWGFKTIGTQGFKTETSNDPIEELETRYRKKLHKLSKKFYKGVKEKAYLKPSALSIATFKLQQKYRADPEYASSVDYNYWKEQGWTDSKQSYYIEHNSGPLRVFLSKLLYGIFQLIF
ncbi:MAG: hypothetical protein BAJALOKI1v1_220024 [Promethearchaeota archaeon]|nr:MAG: hypothetical protein BAJALOKI1v1_220024 [Candidatus Lokiarchaeota archaeon]